MIGVINKSAPFGNQSGQESLDFVLAASNFGQQVSLFFVDDGVFQLLAKQSPDVIEQKDFSKTFKALQFYDIDAIYVCDSSLAQRKLSKPDLAIECEVVDNIRLQSLLASCQTLLRFD